MDIMKVLLLQDVYKLGRAGDVKRVADGFGRNYLLPQRLAVLATPGALKQADKIRAQATVQREAVNKEMSGVADKLEGVVVVFPAKASETGKLYGSVTAQMIADEISNKAGIEVTRRQIDTQPLRSLGEHAVEVRLTVDLVPTVRVIVHREGEAVDLGEGEPVETQAGEAAEVEPAAEMEAEPEAAPEEVEEVAGEELEEEAAGEEEA